MDIKAGQMAYEQGSVFSFFRPEYSPSELAGTGLTSPESQLMSSSNIIGILNGLFSLVKYGLNECNGGFGAYGDCSHGDNTRNLRISSGRTIFSYSLTAMKQLGSVLSDISSTSYRRPQTWTASETIWRAQWRRREASTSETAT
jgi:hypothetical protein